MMKSAKNIDDIINLINSNISENSLMVILQKILYDCEKGEEKVIKIVMKKLSVKFNKSKEEFALKLRSEATRRWLWQRTVRILAKIPNKYFCHGSYDWNISKVKETIKHGILLQSNGLKQKDEIITCYFIVKDRSELSIKTHDVYMFYQFCNNNIEFFD